MKKTAPSGRCALRTFFAFLDSVHGPQISRKLPLHPFVTLHEVLNALNVDISEVDDVALVFDLLDSVDKRPALRSQHSKRHHRSAVDARSTVNEKFGLRILERLKRKVYAALQ